MQPRTGDREGKREDRGGTGQSPAGTLLGGATFESPPASTAFEAMGFRTDPSVSASSSSSNYDVSSSSASSSNGSSISSAIYSISPSCFSLPTASLDYPAHLLKPNSDILNWNRSTRIKTQSHEGEVELVRPANFAKVAHQVYRSSFPQEEHLPFLKSLGLKSVMSVSPFSQPIFDSIADLYLRCSTLVIDDYPSINRKWIDDEGIQSVLRFHAHFEVLTKSLLFSDSFNSVSRVPRIRPLTVCLLSHFSSSFP